MQWLAADDDNGNLNDGTPHMTAIYAAFNRHSIACATPAPVNSGCASGPAAAPSVTATGGDGQVALSWTAVPNATRVLGDEDGGLRRLRLRQGEGGHRHRHQLHRSARSPTTGGTATRWFPPARAPASRPRRCLCLRDAGWPLHAAGVATLSLPADTAMDVALAPVLDWADVAGATSYEVQVATDGTFTSVVRSATALGASTWTVSPALANGTRYYWRVRAVNSCANGAYSAAFSFNTTETTCQPPAAPALASPADAATGVALSPVLDWGDVSGATSYEVQVATDSAFTSVARSATGLGSSTWTVSPALAANTQYFWRARAVNGCGAGSYSGGFRFTTQTGGGTCQASLAAYDAALGTPACGNGCGCDTGTLVTSRGSAVPHRRAQPPNALDGCPDGPFGFYHFDESIDRVVLKSVDGGPITPGKQVKVDVTVRCYDATDRLNLYYTTNPGLPLWSTLATGLTCTGSGAKTFSHTFTVGSGVGQHAIRAQFVEASSPLTSCTFGLYDENDDVVFGVAAAVASGQPPKPATKDGRGRPGSPAQCRPPPATSSMRRSPEGRCMPFGGLLSGLAVPGDLPRRRRVIHVDVRRPDVARRVFRRAPAQPPEAVVGHVHARRRSARNGDVRAAAVEHLQHRAALVDGGPQQDGLGDGVHLGGGDLGVLAIHAAPDQQRGGSAHRNHDSLHRGLQGR